jgi:LysR family transcriptional regulator, regulator of abg operon
MTLQQLRAFLAIVEYGSFRRAARELDVSQAGLTNSLQTLETGLGVTLLQRSATGVLLTPEGKKLFARAQLIDREAQRAVEEAQYARGEASGSLHVGFGPTPTAVLLPLVVPDFHRRFPAVTLKLVSGFHEQFLPALQQGLIELAVTALPDEGLGPALKSTTLFKSDLVVVGRPGHPQATARSLRDLVDCEWILLGSPGGPGGTITRFYAEQGLPAPRVAATCESFTQLAALIGGTDWLALLPAVMVERGLLGTQVVPIKLKERSHRFDNCLVYRADPQLTPAAAAFASMCESCARIVARGRSATI